MNRHHVVVCRVMRVHCVWLQIQSKARNHEDKPICVSGRVEKASNNPAVVANPCTSTSANQVRHISGLSRLIIGSGTMTTGSCENGAITLSLMDS